MTNLESFYGEAVVGLRKQRGYDAELKPDFKPNENPDVNGFVVNREGVLGMLLKIGDRALFFPKKSWKECLDW